MRVFEEFCRSAVYYNRIYIRSNNNLTLRGCQVSIYPKKPLVFFQIHFIIENLNFWDKNKQFPAITRLLSCWNNFLGFDPRGI
jgi:hypothetical protein